MKILDLLPKESFHSKSWGLSLLGVIAIAGYLMAGIANTDSEKSYTKPNSQGLVGMYSGTFSIAQRGDDINNLLASIGDQIDQRILDANELPSVHYVLSHPFDQSKASCLNSTATINL